jgi:hypothetical protein
MGGLSFPRKPWAYGDRVSHSVYRYSCLHKLLSSPIALLAGTPCVCLRVLPYRFLRSPKLRHLTLAPLYFRRRLARPVSYYAFFKGWLLLSQPPGCLSAPTSFYT